MIKVKKFVFNNIQENTYILYDETKSCVIIDPGCHSEAEKTTLKNFITENKLTVTALLNTHCHFDHVFGNAYVCNTFSVETWIHETELPNITRFGSHASVFGITGVEQPPIPTKFLTDGMVFTFGNSELKVIHTPGHCPGCVCFYSEKDNLIISGDTLFRGSIGRTDLPGGDYDKIMNSLLNKLMKLPVDTKVYCGHGPDTDIGNELNHNPFITERME